jgi:DNA adenine methylase
MAKPVIKWVGGKAQLLHDLLPLFPKTIRTYYEPFIGGGACFFTLAAEGRFGHAVINDWNRELTDVYRVVRDFPAELMAALRAREESYAESPEAVFQTWRELDPWTLDPVNRAARMIALNKTCFNGLYRVNSDGKFNAPWGQKLGRVAIFDEDNIRDAAHLLNWKTTILTGDFEEAVSMAREGDFVYFDPPYVPVSETSDFASYTAPGFSLDDQKRLFATFKRLAERGVDALISNSDAPVLRDMFAEFEIHEVVAKRSVNNKGDGRGPVKEIVIASRRGMKPQEQL